MLLDDVLRDHKRWQALAGHWLLDALQTAVVFRIDAVARYVSDQVRVPEQRIEFSRDLPNVAPLADAAWMEWTPTGLGGVTDDACAAGVTLTVMHDRERDGPRPSDATYPDARWLLGATSHIERASGQRALAWPLVVLDVDEQGRILNWGTIDLRSNKVVEPTTAGVADDVMQMWWPVHVALTAICFAHCKGVTTTEHQQARQQRRAAARAGRPPLVSYKTIDIGPVTRILREEGQIEKSGIKKALHICRGHFAHYTNERPLFGKYTGTFFRPMHVRGHLDAGLALKDYRILSGDGPQLD